MNKVDLTTIDVKLLKKQKLDLVTMANDIQNRDKLSKDRPEIVVLNGVINLLDYIQDAIELEPITFDLMYNKDKKPSLKFICPRCQCESLLEICDTDTVINPITRLNPNGDHEYKESRGGDDTQVRCYQCADCDYEIVMPTDHAGYTYTVNDCVALAKWLKRQPYNKTQKQRKVKP